MLLNSNGVDGLGVAAAGDGRTPGEATLELRGVTKFYGAFKAVDEVSFSVPAGRICGFLGPNGAGKTTTIRMILEIIKPTSGSISVLGHSSALEVRHRIGYLPEEKGLYKKMKAWAIIAYFASLKGMERKAAKNRAYELLERYGLKDFADKPTDALSKGMGQKVQMLASIAHDPELVILDEPFSGLDPVNQQVMEEIIRDMAGRGRTVLFSTHVMQHAERLCDRILLVARGRKIFDGTTAEAKRKIPRRVRIETMDDIAALRGLAEVISVRAVEGGNGAHQRTGPVPALDMSLQPVKGPPLPQPSGFPSPPPVSFPTGDERFAQSGPPGEGEAMRPSSGLTASMRNDSTRSIYTLWELEIREDADPQAILQYCFEKGIRLHSFNQSDPTLHEVFVKLVGPDAKEAANR